jgi:hypothetical protein
VILGAQIMSSAQETMKNHRRPRYVIYGLFLILTIALSATTASLYTSNQSLQDEITYNHLISLAQNAEDVDRRIELFVGTYYDQLYWNLGFVLNSTPPADDATKSRAVVDFLSTLRTCADEAYYDFKNDIGYICSLGNYANRTAYDNITETVRVAMGQVGEIGMGKLDFVMQEDAALLINQLFTVIGIDKETQLPSSGLRGIAWSFSRMSDYWHDLATNQRVDWLPTPQVSLNFALANATELYATMSAWSNFTSNPALGQ